MSKNYCIYQVTRQQLHIPVTHRLSWGMWQQLHIPGDPQTACVTLQQQLHILGDPQTACVTLQQQLHIPGDPQSVWPGNTTAIAYTRWPTECLAREHNSYCIYQVTHRVFGCGTQQLLHIPGDPQSGWVTLQHQLHIPGDPQCLAG